MTRRSSVWGQDTDHSQEGNHGKVHHFKLWNTLKPIKKYQGYVSSFSKSAHVCCHLETTSAANAKKLLQMFVFCSPGNQDSFIAALLLVCFWFLTGIWLPKPWRVLKSKPYSVRILLITLVPVGQPHFLFLPTSCLRIIFFLSAPFTSHLAFFSLSPVFYQIPLTSPLLSSFLLPKRRTRWPFMNVASDRSKTPVMWRWGGSVFFNEPCAKIRLAV